MAADYLKNDPFERDVEQAITALKKGTHLLKYGRRGKPKFCPFRLSNDETMLIWYSGRMEKQLNLIQVSRIIPGQRTAIFLRHPRPDKEYQSFSLIYGQRSLDLICKDKDEAEVWFVALKALISRRACKWTIQTKHDKASYRPTNHTCGNSSLASSCCSTNVENMVPKSIQQCGTNHDARPFANFGNIFSDVILYTGEERDRVSTGSASTSKSIISGSADTPDEGVGVSGVDHNVRVSYSSTVSSCSYGSGDDFDSMGDVLLWGKGAGDGKLAYSSHLSRNSYDSRIDASLPKALESTVLLDIHSIACGSKHSVLVTKQGEIYSWGEESGGSRLGHGVDTDVTHPKLISALSGISIESVACGEFHTCAVSFCGDLYTWGDGMHSFGLLGHGNDTAHCIPKKVCGPLDGLQVSSVSCGPWHTAVVTSAGQLFTFGDGVFGALGHGDRRSTNVAREVVSLRGMRTVRAACGAWHTVAIVEVVDSLNSCTSCKLFAWGDGNKGQLGHPDRVARLLPAPVESLLKPSFCQVSCGYDFTVALSTSGQVYTMGSNASGQLGNPTNDGKLHSIIIKGSISSRYVEGIACGSHHVAVLTSKAEVYTWGKGANGRLGHGNNFDRNTPTLVEALKDKQVKSVVCGTDFTAAVCLHKCTSGLDQSICSGCRLQFGFRRKRHNCYNCGLLYCDACSTRKSMKASLAPNSHKTYRVCDECYTKLNTVGDAKYVQNSKFDGNPQQLSSEATDKENRVKNLRVRLSKILTTEPFKPDGKHSRSNSRFPLHHSGNLSVGSINFVGHSKGLISLGNHTSTTSPLSSKPSSPHFTNTLTTSGLASPDYACTYLSNKNLTEEVARLQSQVSELTHKSELLEAELDRTNNQLREAKTTADVENLKCKAAKEVISSLTTQIKSITETAPEECTVVNDSWTGQESKLLGSHFCENHLNDVSRSPDSSVHLAHQLPCKGNGAVADTDWIEQVERGVHITLFRSPAGHKYLRRVRFSKRHFTEEQAARWWAEHRPTLQEQYGIFTGDSIIPSRTSQEKG